MYTRFCPQCNVEIQYEKKSAFYMAKRRNSTCYSCFCQNRKGVKNGFYGRKHTKETKDIIGQTNKGRAKTPEEIKSLKEKNLGVKNKMYGKKVYDIWVEKYGQEKAERLELQRREKISAAFKDKNNPMFGKPSPQGSGNGWSGWYKGWYFRSLLELSYMINVIEKEGLEWETTENVKWGIPYVDYKGVTRTYFPDFLINKNTIVEIKPNNLLESDSVKRKKEAAILWCRERGFVYSLIGSKTFKKLSREQIKSLHSSKAISFVERYEKKFNEIWEDK